MLGPRYPHVVKNAWSVFLDPSRSWDTSDMPVKHQKWGVKSRETVEKPGRNGRKNLPSGPKQHFRLPTYLMMRAAHAILTYTGWDRNYKRRTTARWRINGSYSRNPPVHGSRMKTRSLEYLPARPSLVNLLDEGTRLPAAILRISERACERRRPFAQPASRRRP